jgi:hypothetical protein
VLWSNILENPDFLSKPSVYSLKYPSLDLESKFKTGNSEPIICT